MASFVKGRCPTRLQVTMSIYRLDRPQATLVAILFVGAILAACNRPSDTQATTATPTPLTMPRMPATAPAKTEDSWLVLTNLPENATQIDRGAEIWRLVCQDCHGDMGQGLTQDWIAKWDPKDQNCWQTKCHASNHPPEGFVLPQYVPPLVGSTALGRFETASDLQTYMRDKMPWHKPGSLQDDEYWDLTAFVLDMNGINPLPAQLDAEQGATIHLR